MNRFTTFWKIGKTERAAGHAPVAALLVLMVLACSADGDQPNCRPTYSPYGPGGTFIDSCGLVDDAPDAELVSDVRFCPVRHTLGAYVSGFDVLSDRMVIDVTIYVLDYSSSGKHRLAYLFETLHFSSVPDRLGEVVFSKATIEERTIIPAGEKFSTSIVLRPVIDAQVTRPELSYLKVCGGKVSAEWVDEVRPDFYSVNVIHQKCECFHTPINTPSSMRD